MANSTSSQLKVIALISGGKDSLFSILHCLAQGHEVVALANLHPPALPLSSRSDQGEDSERHYVDDIDSFMYQTVGHEVIPLYAEALGIPLFREEITGSAVDTGREYSLGENGDDEVEDLVPLLEKVMREVPSANAVSTGAILSTYQRTRVEAVAIRLGLVPLSYLWQYLYLPPYRQASLLDDMRTVGQQAKIIKVASGGLDESFLWQDVADQKVIGRMKRRMEMFGGGEGGAVIGEGGEFETLALSGPAPLWKKRIEVEQVDKISGEGGSALTRLKGARLVDIDSTTQPSLQDLRVPALLDDEFMEIVNILRDAVKLKLDMPPEPPKAPPDCWLNTRREQADHIPTDKAGVVYLSNIMSAPYGLAADQTTDIKHQILYKLHETNLTPSSIVHTTILLRDMSAFGTINPIYGSLFTTPNPPSRVTISCGEMMPKGIHVIISMVVDSNREAGRRQGLHVQSRSYWAPANIGPYSQAISVPSKISGSESDEPDRGGLPRVVHVAGQIPLVPASMDMVTAEELLMSSGGGRKQDGKQSIDGFTAQSVLSLQHLWRIGRAMDVTAWTGAVAFLSHSSADETERRASIACETWFNIHQVLASSAAVRTDGEQDDPDVQDDVDVWDIKNRIGELSTSSVEEKDNRPLLKDNRPLLPDYAKIRMGEDGRRAGPPVFAVQVAELPRGADIEWCSTGIASAGRMINYTTRGSGRGYISYDCTVGLSSTSSEVTSYLAFDGMEAVEAFVKDGGEGIEGITAYTTGSLPSIFWDGFGRAMLVPCFSIWRRDDDGRMRGLAVLLVAKRHVQR